MTTFFTIPSRTQVITIIGLVAATGLLGVLVDFWQQAEGFSSSKTGGTQALSTQILLSIIAPWYADFDDSADEVGDSISIVLIDDQFIAERNGVYPLPYEEQSQLIQRITFRRTEHDEEIKPTAVFVDLIYADDRGVRERAKQEQVWREAFRNTDAEQPPLPHRLVPDNIATLGGDFEFAAQLGTQVGAADGQAARAYPPLATGYTGILVADHLPSGARPSLGQFPSASIAPPGSPQTASLYGFVNRLKAPAAPTLFADAPLRYALAPDGMLSPAALLALWTCAAKSFIHRPPGCAVGGFLNKQDIFGAAKAAAIADIAKHCSILKEQLQEKLQSIEDDKKLKEKEKLAQNQKIEGEWRDRCQKAAVDYASQAGWAPDIHQNCQGEACTSATPPAILLLAQYASARRNGRFEGSMAVLHCFDEMDTRLKSTFCSDLHAFDKDPDLERFDDDRIGPMMTVLWGTAPRDIYPAREYTHIANAQWPPQLHAAPYIWAKKKNDQLVDDPCETFRSDSLLQQALASLRGFSSALVQKPSSDPGLCAYHPQLRPSWLNSGNSRTSAFADWAVDGRVVMVGASVAGMEDTHTMRGIQAPGVWAHAMALDNLLTLGSHYRRVSYGLGFDSDSPQKLYQNIHETVISIIIAILFCIFSSKKAIEDYINNYIPWFFHKKVVNSICETVIGLCVFGFFSLIISIFMFMIFPYPPLDWISVAAAATAAWVLATEE